ncbi:MAG: hypothetical protein VXY77_04720 [Pseudomonadota bacterium]|nr:hypothetical protein [Pseudomonadota bacterium]
MGIVKQQSQLAKIREATYHFKQRSTRIILKGLVNSISILYQLTQVLSLPFMVLYVQCKMCMMWVKKALGFSVNPDKQPKMLNNNANAQTEPTVDKGPKLATETAIEIIAASQQVKTASIQTSKVTNRGPKLSHEDSIGAHQVKGTTFNNNGSRPSRQQVTINGTTPPGRGRGIPKMAQQAYESLVTYYASKKSIDKDATDSLREAYSIRQKCSVQTIALCTTLQLATVDSVSAVTTPRETHSHNTLSQAIIDSYTLKDTLVSLNEELANIASIAKTEVCQLFNINDNAHSIEHLNQLKEKFERAICQLFNNYLVLDSCIKKLSENVDIPKKYVVEHSDSRGEHSCFIHTKNLEKIITFIKAVSIMMLECYSGRDNSDANIRTACDNFEIVNACLNNQYKTTNIGHELLTNAFVDKSLIKPLEDSSNLPPQTGKQGFWGMFFKTNQGKSQVRLK